jgi:2-iminobutanoate/2-iminopropanoate deaminase
MVKYVVKGEKIAKPGGPYSPGVKVGDFIFCAGQVGQDPKTGKLGETIEEQTCQALTNLQSILEALGASLSNAVKTTVFLADVSEFVRMNAEYAKFFPKNQPARSTVGSIFPSARLKIEIELVAYVGTK